MIPSPTELTYFLEVANTENLSRAAERLGISQPALTLAMKRLEQSFGQPVLIRGKTGVKLTRAGLQLVGSARSLLEEWNKIKARAEKDEEEIHGVYSIGCHPSVALYTVPSYLKKLLNSYGALELKFTHDLSRKITEEVISNRLDYGIVVNPAPHPDLIIKNMLTDEVTFWVSKKPTPLQDPKSDSAVLICDPDLLQTQSLMKQLNRKGFRFQRTVTTSNLEVVTSMVTSGAGVGVLPGRVATHRKSDQLKILSTSLPKFQDKICLVYRADVQKSKASREIARLIYEGITQ